NVDVDRVHRLGGGGDERNRLEPAEPNQPIEKDRFGERAGGLWIVLELQLPEKLERSECAGLLHGVDRDPWIAADPSGPLRIEAARGPFRAAASLRIEDGGAERA